MERGLEGGGVEGGSGQRVEADRGRARSDSRNRSPGGIDEAVHAQRAVACRERNACPDIEDLVAKRFFQAAAIVPIVAIFLGGMIDPILGYIR